jgi:hypothetical protein
MDDEDLPLEPWAMGMQLVDVQFVREFLVDLNIYRAALASGLYTTEESAKRNSWRVLRRPVILKAVAAAMEERATALKINARTVLGEAWRCYMAAAADRNWSAAAKFLDMAGRHVDVRAFRDRFTPGLSDDEDDDPEGLRNLSDEELETLARLSRKAAGEPEVAAPPSTLRH